MPWQRRSAYGLIALVALAAGTYGVRAQTLFEKLVNPGPVIEAHAKVEGECAKCHAPGQRSSQPGLCLACHKPIDSDRRLTRGFHGRDREASKVDCKQCHTDHKGRAAVIVQFCLLYTSPSPRD